MERIAKFEKVSTAQFLQDWCEAFASTEDEAQQIYNSIRLPRRATAGSAGYDFFVPVTLTLQPGETVKMPTGIRAWMQPGWVLQIFPRSSLGFRYRLQMDNTVGIIDSDYYHANNEGHIFIKITNDSKTEQTVHLMLGEGFAQGVFLPFGITLEDDASEIRTGGIGSTTEK